MDPQQFLSFEQAVHDGRAKMKAELAAARAAAKKQEEIEKCSRRNQRAAESKRRKETEMAICGINFYTRRVLEHNGWSHCKECGAALKFYDNYADAQANAGACKPYVKPPTIDHPLSTPSLSTPPTP